MEVFIIHDISRSPVRMAVDIISYFRDVIARFLDTPLQISFWRYRGFLAVATVAHFVHSLRADVSFPHENKVTVAKN